jgi:biotin carboxyl carrier protein
MMHLLVTVGQNSEKKVAVKGSDIFLEGKKMEVDFIEETSGKFHVLKNGKSFWVEIEKEEDAENFKVKVGLRTYIVKVKDSLTVLLDQLGMSIVQNNRIAQLKSPMPGLILKVLVKSGDQLSVGDPLIILEAMKMENIIKTSVAATVKEILVESGQKVEKGEKLIIFE